MRILDRYIFRQLIVPVLGAVAALTAIALLSQSLSQFDLIVERGQSAWTFMRVTLLSLPQLAGLIFPIAIFVGTLIALTRLQSEHEITAVRAAGSSLMRLASPMIRIGVWFALISLVSNLFLQPLTARAMRGEMFRIRNDLISSLVKEGAFSTASSGLTIYVQRIDQNGLLRQIFIRTPEANGKDRTYVASEGKISNVDGANILIMRRGSTQQVNDSGAITNATFDETSFDVSRYFSSDDFLHYKEGDRYIHELFFPNIALDWEKGNRTKLQAEGHARLAGPLYNLTFMLLAIVAVLGGQFRRGGYGQRIAAVAGIAAVVRILGIAAETASAGSVVMNVLQYAVPIIPIVICLRLLHKRDSKRGLARSQRMSTLETLRPAA
ncbi:LptF/LptG family permease [Asticcacaulis sp. BE141]|nr:LptF/LptG family permease [Asticcacaulis sp. BE141]